MAFYASQIGDLMLCSLNVERENQEHEHPKNTTKIKHVLVIDNSASMSGNTRIATEMIGRNLFGIENVSMVPGDVFLFDTDVYHVLKNASSPNDFDKIQYPRQGLTNITKAISDAITHIDNDYRRRNYEDIHYILTFLSDGQHNNGETLNDRKINEMSKRIRDHNIKLSIIVVGIGSSSDTKLGMMIKTGIESIQINTLENIYFASKPAEMKIVLNELVTGISSSIESGKPVQLTMMNSDKYSFFETSTQNYDCYMNRGRVTFILDRKSMNNDELPIIKIKDGDREIVLNANIRKPHMNDISEAINSIMPYLGRKKIAKGIDDISVMVQKLERLIATAKDMFKEENEMVPNSYDGVGKTKIDHSKRRLMIKSLNRQKTLFQEEYNRLRSLYVQIENDSSKQAQFLSGMGKKYGSKAVIKAGTIDKNINDVIDDLTKTTMVLETAIAKDTSLRDAYPNNNIHASILSLNTPFEQYQEWLDQMKNFDRNEYSNIYDLLVSFGLSGYSVKFQHNNAVQMDPFQTLCEKIDICPVDTPNVLLAQQLNREIKSYSNEMISDCLVLVDPSSPNSSLFAMRSDIYHYVASIVLCRDLYMYHSKMTFSMHAHTLVKTIEEYSRTKSRVYIEFGARILYSIRKFWGSHAVVSENVELFKRWWNDWSTITQSQNDECNHPVQLLLMLGALDFREIGAILSDKYRSHPPLLNLLNETLARISKMMLHTYVSSKKSNGENPTTDEIKKAGIKIMQKTYGITSDNSPQPNPDDTISEPTIESTREGCVRWIDWDDYDISHAFKSLNIQGCDNVIEFINQKLMPIIQTYHFCYAIQEYVNTNGGWNVMCEEFEKVGGVPISLIDSIKASMDTIDNMDVLKYMSIDSKDYNLVANTIFTQAILHPLTDTRNKINEQDIRDASTFNEMIVDLRMDRYLEASKEKRLRWVAIESDVTYARAISCDLVGYGEMIGGHSHSGSKGWFLAMARVALLNDDKLNIFKSKSNDTVDIYLNKLRKAMKH